MEHASAPDGWSRPGPDQRCKDYGMTRALMLIDVQRNMLEPPTPVPAAASIREALQDLLLRARGAGALVIHVQNDGPPGEPDEPGTDGWQLVFPASAGELIVRKDQPDTFAANPELVKDLAAQEITEVVIAGMQSNYCVAESSRGAQKQGLQAILASGAHATYDENEPASAISAQIERELATEGISVLSFRKVSFGEAS
jgi:streptothricin hydrolase